MRRGADAIRHSSRYAESSLCLLSGLCSMSVRSCGEGGSTGGDGVSFLFGYPPEAAGKALSYSPPLTCSK